MPDVMVHEHRSQHDVHTLNPLPAAELKARHGMAEAGVVTRCTWGCTACRLLQTLNLVHMNPAELKARHDAAEAGVEYEPGQKPVHRTSMVGGIAATQQTAGTGQYLHEVEDRRAIKVRQKSSQ